MSLIFFVLSLISVLAVLLIYDYFYTKIQYKKFNKISATSHLEIAKLKLSEQSLRNEITALQDKLHASLEDPVTQLPIRELFENRLEVAIKESARYQFTLGVMCVDVNDFRLANEAFGYEVGNLLLSEIGKRLQKCVRQIDTIARLNKDTFGVLLTKLNKPETAAIVAQRILYEFQESFLIQDHELHINVSVGIALYPLDAQDGTNLLRKAEEALDQIKSKNKNQYQFYQKEMQVESHRKLSLYDSLSRESIFQECILFYQPIINIQTKEIDCVDVLLSCHHPELGIISAMEFFDAAEKQGRLTFISDWLMSKVCKEFLKWQAQDFKPKLIALTLPVKQFENQHFIHNFSQIMKKLEFNPSNLLLQIKGNFSQIDQKQLEKTLHMLDYMGVRIAIDDMDSTSLPLQILKIDIHYLKLSPSLVINLSKDEKTRALVNSILYLGKSMGKTVIAKGVETQMQMIDLKNLGCLLMQGQFFYPPLEEKEIVSKIKMKTLA